jgi:hypothetical protein
LVLLRHGLEDVVSVWCAMKDRIALRLSRRLPSLRRQPLLVEELGEERERMLLIAHLVGVGGELGLRWHHLRRRNIQHRQPTRDLPLAHRLRWASHCAPRKAFAGSGWA